MANDKCDQLFDNIIGIQNDIGLGINYDSQRYNNRINLDECAFNNPNFVSRTQALAGPPNPKTLIQPVIPAKALDIDYWKVNNLVENSAINSVRQREMYLNGYAVSTCCPSSRDSYSIPVNPKNIAKVPLTRPLKKNISTLEQAIKARLTDDETLPPKCLADPTIRNKAEHFDISLNDKIRHKVDEEKKKEIIVTKMDADEEEKKEITTTEIDGDGDEIKQETILTKIEEPVDNIVIVPNESGWVNTNCGYNPEQLFTSNLPTNLPVGNCQRDQQLATYNENLFTQTIQPGVFTHSEIIEPINSNIGISFDQQIPPTTVDTNPINGEYMFTEHDPRIIEPITFKEIEPNNVIPNEYNIYDPRFTGAGTSYRSYTDDLLGQPKFYYDDIDAVKMPNYIVRSHIDNQPYADSYGPIPAGDEFGNKNNADIRKLANQSFVDSAITFRTEMMQRLMRKRNTEQWQQRKAPINTMGQRMLK